ncbi:MAG TPA: sugar phosphate isomerase/epimerase family protein [Armatimonadota bacterium]|nr:sugar phosphate isomerase/epimerase family protein [Armatimonadota bacterium]
MASVSHFMTPEIADAFRHSTLSAVELTLAAIEHDDQHDGPSRRLIHELIDEGTMSVASMHLPFGVEWDVSSPDETERQHAIANILGMLARNLDFGSQYLTLHGSCEILDVTEHPTRLTQVRKSITDLLPFIQQHGMRLAVEYLPRMCLGNHEEELLEMVAPFERDYVGICLDVNHVMGRYAELPRIIESLGERLFTLHLSDYDGVDEKHWFPGQGIIYWSAVMETLRRSGSELYLFYETKQQLTECDSIFTLRQVENNIRMLESCCSCAVWHNQTDDNMATPV